MLPILRWLRHKIHHTLSKLCSVMLASELSSLSLKYIARDFWKCETRDHEGFSRIDGDLPVPSAVQRHCQNETAAATASPIERTVTSKRVTNSACISVFALTAYNAIIYTIDSCILEHSAIRRWSDPLLDLLILARSGNGTAPNPAGKRGGASG